MTKRTLGDIVKEYQAHAKIAGTNLETISPQMIAGFGAKKQIAEARVKELKVEFMAALQKCSAGLLLVDVPMAKAKRFCSAAERIASMVAVNSDKLYQELTAAVVTTMSDRTWPKSMGADQWLMLFDSIRTICSQLNYETANYPDPGTAPSTFLSVEEMTSKVKTMITKANGDGLNCAYIAHVISTELLKLDPEDEIFANPIVPVIVTGLIAIEVKGLTALFGLGVLPVTELPPRDSINKDTVIQILETFKNQIKSQKDSKNE